MVLMGDFNYPDIDWPSHSVYPSAPSGLNEFFKLVEEHFLTQHVNSPTHGDAILDLVFSRAVERLIFLIALIARLIILIAR